MSGAFRHPEDTPPPSSVPSHVLLVEDNKFNQELIKVSLIKAGCTSVDTASDGLEAVSKGLGRPGGYDVILMDVQMPVMDGIEATRVLRARGYKGKILALSANADDFTLTACRHAGVNEYLVKPITLEHLREILNRPAQQ